MSTHLHQEDDFKARLDTGLWWKLFQRTLRLKRFLVPLTLCAIAIAVCDAGFAHITRWTIDAVVEGGSAAHLTPWILAYAGVVLVFCTGVWVFIDCAGAIANHLGHDIRAEAFDRLQSLEFAFYDTRPVGWLITRLTSDCDRLARVVAWGFLDLVWGCAYVVMIAASLLVMNWKLGLIVVAVVPPLAIISKVFQRKILLSAREIRKYNSQITASFNEAIQGVRTTKTLVREEENLREFQGLSTQMFLAAVTNARQSAFYYPLIMTVGSIGAGVALWRGGILVIDDDMSLGTLVAFINFSGQFFFPINQLANKLTEMQGAQAAGERVLGLLATEPAIRDSPEVLARIAAHGSSGQENTPSNQALAHDGHPDPIGEVEFRNVGFRYGNGPQVLHDFSLSARAGEMIALVGPSGGGKSTIVSLVCRFYEPTSGHILIDGIDFRDRSLGWLQSQLGIVLQTPHLFKGTVRENIRYGRLDATDTEIEDAARKVNADGFIRALESGYESQVGEGGNRLSTGQRQLISFARALLADPQIFVMDEATSSIDTETEQLIQRGLETVFSGRISFVIAHRLSTIRRATRILVIANGCIEESGTHEELLRRRGRYFELYTSQFRAEREHSLLEGAH
ncbi:MAG: ABC transporter ATP-binding protein [Opitutaceae bacterium]|nr:ABC transporter ATP-binding protein [Opitutaceae bacterium]